jgi:CRISPR/Cas system-associated protein Cas10 (large subunit of type III CRISPR-Cas system)
MEAICRWVGIDANYFCDFLFEVRNKSVKMRNSRIHRTYFKLRENAREVASDYPSLRRAFAGMGRRLNQAYRKMNVTSAEKIVVPIATEEIISSYYKNEPILLESLFGIKTPWPRWEGGVTADAGTQLGEVTRASTPDFGFRA